MLIPTTFRSPAPIADIHSLSHFLMTSYFRSWLTGATVPEATPDDAVISISPPEEEDEGSDTPTETERDDDSPPAFPSLLSAQRVRSSTRRAPTDSDLMPPPQFPSPSSSSSNPMSSSSLTVLTTTKPSKKRAKIALAPGHGPLDWANLKASGKDLRVRSLPQ